MIKIGDFSKLSLLSVRVLRHYDEIGLLKPEYIDLETGYRYYKPHQLHTCHQIKTLRSVGLGLGAISDILHDKENIDVLNGYLKAQRDTLKDEITGLEDKLVLLESMVDQLEMDDDSSRYSVNIKEIPKRNIASIRKQIEKFEAEGMLWDIMMRTLSDQKISLSKPPYFIAKFHDNEYKDRDVDVEIQVSVMKLGDNTNHVSFMKTNEEKVASVVMKGSYRNMDAVNSAAVHWIAESQYEFSGPIFNIYHVGPNEESA